MDAPQEASPQEKASQEEAPQKEASQEAFEQSCQARSFFGAQAYCGGSGIGQTSPSEKTMKWAFWVFEGVSCVGIAGLAYVVVQAARHALW